MFFPEVVDQVLKKRELCLLQVSFLGDYLEILCPKYYIFALGIAQ